MFHGGRSRALCSQSFHGNLWDKAFTFPALPTPAGRLVSRRGLSIDFYAHRAMVGALHLGADEGALEAGTQRLRDQEKVDAPADVPVAGPGHGAPPRVMAAAFLELAEGVEETRLHKRVEAGAFFGREPVVPDIGLGVGEVKFSVRHVQVAAKNHR